jgi:hypothetical protein
MPPFTTAKRKLPGVAPASSNCPWISLFFAAAGIFFGYYPCRRLLSSIPIEALCYK